MKRILLIVIIVISLIFGTSIPFLPKVSMDLMAYIAAVRTQKELMKDGYKFQSINKMVNRDYGLKRTYSLTCSHISKNEKPPSLSIKGFNCRQNKKLDFVHCLNKKSPVMFATTLFPNLCPLTTSNQFILNPTENCLEGVARFFLSKNVVPVYGDILSNTRIHSFHTFRMILFLDYEMYPVLYRRKDRLDLIGKYTDKKELFALLFTKEGWYFTIGTKFENKDRLLTFLDKLQIHKCYPVYSQEELKVSRDKYRTVDTDRQNAK